MREKGAQNLKYNIFYIESSDNSIMGTKPVKALDPILTKIVW